MTPEEPAVRRRAVSPRRQSGARALAGTALLAALLLAPAALATAPGQRLMQPWPAAAETAQVRMQRVTFASRSPFGPAAARVADPDAPRTPTQGTLFLPVAPSADAAAPAVVVLHGSGGVLDARELTYARQLAAMGVAALVVDAFASRAALLSCGGERLVQVTETMLVADAYAALRFLQDVAAVDASRVALIGFSYGGLATLIAAFRQVAEAVSPGGPRFVGHAAFYPPCIVSLADPRTSGAPVLLLQGGGDTVNAPGRCAALADELRAGGSTTTLITYPEAVHQWDGAAAVRRLSSRTPADCRFRVERDDTVRDERTGWAMDRPFARRLMLTLCTGEPYPVQRNDAVRARSNRDLGRFLGTVLSAAPGGAWPDDRAPAAAAPGETPSGEE